MAAAARLEGQEDVSENSGILDVLSQGKEAKVDDVKDYPERAYMVRRVEQLEAQVSALSAQLEKRRGPGALGYLRELSGVYNGLHDGGKALVFIVVLAFSVTLCILPVLAILGYFAALK